MLQRFRKWFKVDRTDNINYSDRIVRFIVKTTYAKKKFSLMLLMLITVIIRFNIDILCSIVFKFNNPYIDFWVQIMCSVMLVIKSDWIYWIVEKFSAEINTWTTSMINNYTEAKYVKWKRIITFSICLNLMIYLYCVEVTSQMLQLAIIQYMVCYILIEIIEKKMYNHVVQIFDTKEQNKKTFTHTDSDLKINYSFSPEIDETERTPHTSFELDKDLFDLSGDQKDPPKPIINDPPPLKLNQSSDTPSINSVPSPTSNGIPPSPAPSIQSTSSTSSSPMAPPPTPIPTPILTPTFPVFAGVGINLNQCLKENHITTAPSSGTNKGHIKDHSNCNHTTNQQCEKIFIVNDSFTFRKGTITSRGS